MNKQDTTYLDQLEAEAIFILREVAGQFEKPALLFQEERILLLSSGWQKKPSDQVSFLFP